MTHDAATGKTIFPGSSTLPPMSFDQVLNFKYLGISLCSSPRRLFHSYNEQVKRKAQNYLSSVLSLVKAGPDRSDLAYTLWTRCALPAILYGAEIIPLTQATISFVERCQVAVGKFILQIPSSSANAAVYIDAGLKPVWSTIAERVLVYAYTVMGKPSSFWPKMAMNENLKYSSQSPYAKNLLKWKQSTTSLCLPPKQIKATIKRAAIIDVLKQQRSTGTTTFAMNGPALSSSHQWFKPKKWVSDSCCSQIFSQFRSCNSGLGNRIPAKDGKFYKLCPPCANLGIKSLNNEVSSFTCIRPNPNC